MPTVKLTPSSYYVSSAVLSVSNEENMYTDISSTTYATLTNTDKSTSYYYFYLRGFNIGDVPANAVVSSFTVKIRGRASGAYNSAMYLAHGTSTITGATATQFPNSSTVATRTFANGELTWSDIVGYGDTFGIRINCRRNAKNTQSYYYIYGAEIEVTYSIPQPVTDKMYIKVGGEYVLASHVYKKVSGAWVEQTNLTNVFDAGTNYKSQ